MEGKGKQKRGQGKGGGRERESETASPGEGQRESMGGREAEDGQKERDQAGEDAGDSLAKMKVGRSGVEKACLLKGQDTQGDILLKGQQIYRYH